MEIVEVKPTWRLAWGLWWRGFLISLGISVIIGAIMFILLELGVLDVAGIFEKLSGCLLGGL